MKLFLALLLFIFGLILLLGGFLLFIWTAQRFWSGVTWEYFMLALMIMVSGVTLMAVAWRLNRQRQ